MLYFLPRYDRFRKERDKYKISLMNGSSFILPRIQHQVVLLVLRTAFAVSFWLLSFLQLKLWARISLQMGNTSSAVFPYLCVNFHKCVSVVFLRLNLTSYLCSEFYGHDWLQTWRYKTRDLWGLFAEVREKSVLGLLCSRANRQLHARWRIN